jgi:hypothetical protein
VRNANDGAGNHIYLGVTEDTAAPLCRLTGRRFGPVAQIDVTIQDAGTGVASLTLFGEVNVQTHHYFTSDRAPIVLAASRTNPGQAAEFGVMVIDGARNSRMCSFRF